MPSTIGDFTSLQAIVLLPVARCSRPLLVAAPLHVSGHPSSPPPPPVFALPLVAASPCHSLYSHQPLLTALPLAAARTLENMKDAEDRGEGEREEEELAAHMWGLHGFHLPRQPKPNNILPWGIGTLYCKLRDTLYLVVRSGMSFRLSDKLRDLK